MSPKSWADAAPRLIAVAAGRAPADMVVRGGTWANVQSGEMIPATDLAIADGRFAYCGPDASPCIGPDTVVIEAAGRVLSPGLIDAHMHVESGMLTVTEFVRAVAPHGSTSLFIDPHEIANVLGLKGVRLMHDEAMLQPTNVFVQAPSCVPSAPGLEVAGAEFGPDEIAETIVLPDALAGRFAVRGYYGTLRHNSRAVYQRYFGWYDGVPANLDPLPRGEAAQRYVDLLGGVEAVIAEAETAFADGDYRWSAELAQHAVYAAPGNEAAAAILARSYEQLGYRAESAPWRDVYLSAARELRHGIPQTDAVRASEGILDAIPLDMFFAAMATRIDGPRAARNDRVFNFVFTDVGETHVIELSNGVMHHHRGEPRPDADATVELTRTFWMRLLQQEAGLVDMLASQEFAIRGDRRALLGFFALLEQPDPDFPVVTGRPDAR